MPTNQTLTITAPRSGPAFLADTKDHVEGLWKISTILLTSVGGTASAITATCSPAPAALLAGMSFAVVLTKAPTSGATLKINALGAAPLARPDGAPIQTGDLPVGLAQFTYTGGKLRVGAITARPAAGAIGSDQIIITRTSLIPSTTLDTLATSKAWRGKATAAGYWKLKSIQINPKLGYSNACIIKIERYL